MWQKWKISAKIENFGKNGKFGQKQNMLAKMQNFGKNAKFLSKIEGHFKVMSHMCEMYMIGYCIQLQWLG